MMEMCCIVDKNMEKVDCQLQNVEVVSNIDGMIAEVTVYQKYQNVSNADIEALYTFPLINEGKVTGFKAKIGETEFESEFRDKEEVYKEYDKAVRQGESAYLLENYREDFFQISIGNIPAREKVIIAITYIEDIKINDGEIRWILPSLIAPTYMLGNKNADEYEEKIYYPTYRTPDKNFKVMREDEALYTLKITVTIKGLRYIKVIESPSHQISISMGRDLYVVKLAKHNVFLDSDFILTVKLEKYDANSLNLAITEENEVFAEARFTFEMDKYITKKHEYIFLLDISRSMYGEKFEEAKRVLECSLRNLDKGDYFDIIAFESHYRILSKTSLPFNGENYHKAVKWINNLKCSGEKELYDIMYYLLEGVEPKADLGKVIVLITDGQVENEIEIINMVKSYNKIVKVFTFGVSALSNKVFIDGISKVSNGAVEYMDMGEKIEKKVIKQIAKINHPVVNFKKVVDSYGVDVEIVPNLPSKLYFSNMYTFFIRNTIPEYLERLTNLAICVDIYGEEFELQLFKTGNGDPRLLSIKWVNEKIKELENQLYNSYPLRDEEIKKEIADLSKKYRIISSETSLIGVYKKSNQIDIDDSIAETFIVPVSKPIGWRMLNNNHMFDSSMNNRFKVKNTKIRYDSQIEYNDEEVEDSANVGKSIEEFEELNKRKNSVGKFIGFINKGIKSFIYGEYDEKYNLSEEQIKNGTNSKNISGKVSQKLEQELDETSLYDEISGMIETAILNQNIDGSFGNIQNSNYKTACFIIAMLLLDDEATLLYNKEIIHAGTSLLSEVDNDILFKTIALDMLLDTGMIHESDMFRSKDEAAYKYIGDYVNEMIEKLNILERQSFEDFKSLKDFDINSLIVSFLKAVVE